MTVASVEIPLADHFDHPQGLLSNYDAYDTAQRAQLTRQRHRDIRTFAKRAHDATWTMFTIDAKPMDDLSGVPMSDFGGTETIYDEGWTVGTIGPQADRNNWNGIAVPVPVGNVVTQSVMSALDLSDMAATDDLSLALPAFPAASLNLSQCFVDFTSHAAGDFTTGPTVSVPMTGLAAGDRELKVAMSTLAPLAYSVTGVRFRLTGTAATTFRCLAIRALSSGWLYAPLDVNTRLHRVMRPVSRNGAASATPAFPANAFADAMVPVAWPILFRATTPSSNQDPRPIDLSEAVVFNTGHRQGGDIRLYFREYAYDLVTQLDLDLGNGATGLTQAQLEVIGRQLDFDKARYLAKRQSDIDAFTQAGLDGTVQYNLEAQPDFFTASWVEARIQWTGSGTVVTIRDTEGNAHTFPNVSVVPNQRYVAFIELREHGCRVRIHRVSESDVVDFDRPVFDSTLVTDDFMFARRSGRVGWYADFQDGDAYLESIRTYDANFAEYRSVPLRSISPVIGGQVFYGGSPPREHFTGLSEEGSAVVRPDGSKSASGKSYRVESPQGEAHCGIQSNPMLLDNFRETTVSFDLWFPSDAYDAGGRLAVFLTDDFGQQHYLNLGRTFPNRWQPFRFDLEVFHGTLLPGLYQLHIMLMQGGIKSPFFLDNISVRQQMIVWWGRAEPSDPWEDGKGAWTDFKEDLNSYTAGALFPQVGHRPQVRAVARRQNVELTQVKFLPKYAELGRLVWDDEKAVSVPPTITQFTITGLGPQVGFSVTDADVTVEAGQYVAYYEWDFGDGEFATGSEASHVYAASGTYRPALTVVDSRGRRVTRFQIKTVVTGDALLLTQGIVLT